MTNAAELIVKGMKIEALPNLPRAFDGLRRCAVTGELIESGYLVSDITAPASNEFMDTFRGDPCGVVSETVGRAFRNDHNMGARLFFEDGTMYYPLISRESAAKDGNRPCWSDLVYTVWNERQGQQLLCLLTTDSKKRLWPRARVGALGRSTPVYLHDNKTAVSDCFEIDWPRMIVGLNLIEQVYTAGFSKNAIRESLHSDYKTVNLIGYKQSCKLESYISCWRGGREFDVALLIAQKPLEEKEK